ncbi:hypothetical protein [Kribbella sp. NPDC051718]|uniref:beta family protein n=1 Tax=Kribbella sp. NPDC051718 TaxID=3155168 RepID=UPI00343DB1DE
MISAGDFHTLVALRAKEGEVRAVEAVQEDRGVQPLLQYEVPKKSLDGQVENIERIARKFHALGRLIMVDASALAAAPTFGGEQLGGLGSLADRLSAAQWLDQFQDQIPFVPVASLDLAVNQLTWIGRLCAELGAGGALRVGRAVGTGEVESIVDALKLAPPDIDLIIDVGYLEYFTPQIAEAVSAALDALRTVGSFRSMTLLSGSVPSILDETALWERPRFEEVLWRAVVDGGGKDVRFGDYGVVHPGATRSFRSHHVNVKYTCQDHWLLGRERMADSKAQAKTLGIVCRNLIESDSFSGPEFSWGDREIVSAASDGGTGNSLKSKPVAIGTSHHLAYLASLNAA